MSYSQARDREQLQRLREAVDDFISRYQANSSTNRKTVILFPGGMGSQLVRATTPHEDGRPFFYDMVWLDCSILFGAALDLKMQGDLDSENRYVISDGCVDFPFFDLRPYQNFIHWCEQNGLDWFVFGWDWRRRLEDSADFFLNRFLPMFRRRVGAACGVDPLQNYALIGHSMGGMVVKLILNRGGPFVDSLSHAITVATPFYGHGGHVHRYFKGDPYLNSLYGTARVTEAISTMPGGYALLFLDKDTYDRDKNALGNDPQYPLLAYPSVDADDSSIIADPYDPRPTGGLLRYPQRHGFDHAKLQQAKPTYHEIAAPLPNPGLNQKFYNIRGVKVSGGSVVSDTINSQTWQQITPQFNADVDPDPISDVTVCPGDGLIPAWSARLVSAGHIITIEGDLEHMYMMNSPLTHDALTGVLNLAPKRRSRAPRATPKVATAQDLRRFLDDLAATLRQQPEISRDQVILRYLSGFSRADLKALLGRAYMDALKSPSQKLGTAPTDTPPFYKREQRRRRQGTARQRK